MFPARGARTALLCALLGVTGAGDGHADEPMLPRGVMREVVPLPVMPPVQTSAVLPSQSGTPVLEAAGAPPPVGEPPAEPRPGMPPPAGPAADAGNAMAQNNLAAMYENGDAMLPRSNREAARLYRMAAEQFYPDAQTSMAGYHATGTGGVARDDREAVRLWRLAAAARLRRYGRQ